MTSFRQIEANRRNARFSTGPATEEGKQKSRQNAVRHGLTAETVIDALEDAEDYAAFEMAVTDDYDAQSAVERELVLRLASLLWRLRRAPPSRAACSRSRRSTCFSSANGANFIRIARRSSTACTEIPSRPKTVQSTSRLARRQVQYRPVTPRISSTTSRTPLSACPIYQPTPSIG